MKLSSLEIYLLIYQNGISHYHQYHCIVIPKLQLHVQEIKFIMGRRVRVRHNIVRQLISNCVIAMEFVRLEKNLVDPLTKGLTR